MKKKINVVITKDDADAVSDWSLESWYKNLKDGDTARLSSILMFNEIRVGVSRGEVEPFTFTYDGEELSVDSNGEVQPRWPDGFGDHLIIQMDMLLLKIDRTEAIEKNKSK